jgi:hypothetical protein
MRGWQSSNPFFEQILSGKEEQKMKNVIRTFRLWAVLCLLGCLILPMVHHSGSALFAQAVHYKDAYRSPFDWTGFNPCAGEECRITGTYVMHIFENISASGKYQFSIHARVEDGAYLGLSSGKVLKMNNVELYRENFELPYPTFPLIIQYTGNSVFIGKGSEANYSWKTMWHVTVNANGELTAYIDRDEWSCH